MAISLQVVSQNQEETTHSQKQIEAQLRRKLDKFAELKREILQLMQEYGKRQFRSNLATVHFVGESYRQSVKVEDMLQLADEHELYSEFEELIRQYYVKPYWTIKTLKQK